MISMSPSKPGNSKPKVSVLMAVFNTAPYLSEALNSVSSQTFTDFELLVVDDGSTDGSTEILKSFALTEPRMKLVSRENMGLIATRNELLQLARAELIAWMDSDDISVPDRLTMQVERFAEDPELICLGGYAQCIDPDGQLLNVERYPSRHQDILLEQKKGGAMRFPTTMMRRDAAMLVGGFREPFRIGEDFDLLLRLSEMGKMANIPTILYLYRQHLSSVCATLGPRWMLYRDQILQMARERELSGKDRLQNGDLVAIPSSEALGNTKQLESQIYVRWAEYAFQNQNFQLASKYIRRSITDSPYAVVTWKLAAKVLLGWVQQSAARAFSHTDLSKRNQ